MFQATKSEGMTQQAGKNFPAAADSAEDFPALRFRLKIDTIAIPMENGSQVPITIPEGATICVFPQHGENPMMEIVGERTRAEIVRRISPSDEEIA